MLAPILAVALLDLAGDAALTYATADDDLGVVSVLASRDPVVTVCSPSSSCASALPLRQGIGVTASLAGVVLVGAGG